MTGFWFQLVTMLVAVNPAAVALVADDGSRRRQAAVALPAALSVLTAAVLLAAPMLDWLEISPESFRMAAGLVMAVQGASMVWDPEVNYRASGDWKAGIIPLGWPAVANAGAVMAAISFAADGSNAQVVGAAAAASLLGAAVVATATGSRHRASLIGLGRMAGALLVANAAALAVSGVRAV